MAGYANIGEPGYQISPPNLSRPQGSTGYLNLSIPRMRRGVSPYFSNPYEAYTPGADTSGQHEANVYMAQNGLGDMKSNIADTLPNYGFSAEDWANINRFLVNPQSNTNTAAYQGISNRVRNNVNSNPYFAQWLPEQRNQFGLDYPAKLANYFNIAPPYVNTQLGVQT